MALTRKCPLIEKAALKKGGFILGVAPSERCNSNPKVDASGFKKRNLTIFSLPPFAENEGENFLPPKSICLG